MTKDQIKTYENCKEYMESLSNYKRIVDKQIPSQVFGCGRGDHPSTSSLQNIHSDMKKDLMDALNSAERRIQKKIDAI